MTTKGTPEAVASMFRRELDEGKPRMSLAEYERARQLQLQKPAMCWRQVVRRMNEEKPYITDRDPGDEGPNAEEVSSCR